MEPDFRFGIWERLAVIGLVVGVAGLIAGVSMPPPYQEWLAQNGFGHALFWGSVAIILAAILFFICDLALYILVRRGVKVGIALASIGTALIIIGAFVGLIGAFKIDNPAPAAPAQSGELAQPRPADSHIPNRTERFGDLAVLSNSDLRRLTTQFAIEMRGFEANLEQWRVPPMPNLQAVPPEEREKLWNDYGEELGAAYKKKTASFIDNIYGDMTALLNELKTRLQRRGILVPEPSPMALPALSGSLAGAHPIQHASEYLELLARRLPD